MNRLVYIRVLIPVHYTGYFPLELIMPKKEGTLRFVICCHHLNKNVVHKACPYYIVTNTMQQLDGFQFATALDLNMGNYTI